MTMFSNTTVSTTSGSPNFVIGEYTGPNVSQYGWTEQEEGWYIQLLSYVEECRVIKEYLESLLPYLENTEDLANQIKTIYESILVIQSEIEIIYGDFINKYSLFEIEYADFLLKFADFSTKYADFLLKYQETLDAATSAASSASSASSSANSAAYYYGLSYDIYLDLKQGQIYRGVWNPHTGVYPDPEGTNSVWDVQLNEGETEYSFDNKVWRWGDRLLYILDTLSYSQLQSGSNVSSVNTKTGAVVLNASDVGAVNKTGDTMSGNLTFITPEQGVLFESGPTGVGNGLLVGNGDGASAELSNLQIKSWHGLGISPSTGNPTNENTVWINARNGNIETIGNITANKALVSSAQGVETNALTRKDYVDSELMDDSSTYKIVELNPVSALEAGKYYPVLLVFPSRVTRDVSINTVNTGGDYPINSCSFSGQVLGSGWIDARPLISGDFSIYDMSERAIHSAWDCTQTDNRFVFYLEARAFPTSVRVARDVEVVFTGADISTGSSVFKAGVTFSDTETVPPSTNTRMVLPFDKGGGWYTSGPLFSNGVDSFGDVIGNVFASKVGQSTLPNSLTRKDYVDGQDFLKVNKTGDTMTGVLRVNSEIQTEHPNSYRHSYGGFGTFWRNDGHSLYLMLTNNGDPYGDFNNLRPFRTELATGRVFLSGESFIGYEGQKVFHDRYAPRITGPYADNDLNYIPSVLNDSTSYYRFIYNVGNSPNTVNNANGLLHISTNTIGSFAHQMAFSSDGKIYTRYNDDSSWSGWGSIYTSTYKPTPLELGAVDKAGDTMSGNLLFNDINRGVRFDVGPIGSNGLMSGNGDGASSSVSNVQFQLWHGLGFAPSTGNPTNANTVWINARNGNIDSLGDITASKFLIFSPQGDNPNSMTRKDYVDGLISTTNSNFANYLPLTGGNLTGQLTAPLISIGSTTTYISNPTGDTKDIAIGSDRYSFITSRDSTHVCSNSYWDGAWKKYNNEEPSAMVVATDEARVRVMLSDANSSDPNQHVQAEFTREGLNVLGKINTTYTTKRGWAAPTEAALYVNAGTVANGNLVGVTDTWLHYPGIFVLGAYTGHYIGSGPDETAQVLGWSDGAGYNKSWHFRAGGTIQYSAAVGGNDWVTFTAPRLRANDFEVLSDVRVKSNFEKIENPLGKVLSLSGLIYDKKIDETQSKREAGVIAQEVQSVLPEAVNEGKDGMLGVSSSGVIALLVEAIKELKQEVDELKKKGV